ncbi:LRCH3-like protein [Mya arenaria]|uniref:LRCH3-like protein n=1 Tax=Mya arenaria TaxID=6604 RepID=A0ABY7G1G8_MYAAR|nr:LRCH3-like protein [Mya arenaria]
MPEMATTYHGGGSQSPTAISKPIERVFEDAQHTGEILLNGRKLREYPKLAAKYDLVDTISADVSKNRMAEVPKELRNQLSIIPPFISQLQTLEVLIASHNRLVSLPEEIGVLDKLMELDVSCNEISHLPLQIGDLKSLKSLNNGVDLPHIVESNNLAMRAAAAVCREPCYPAPAVTYREPRRPPPEPPMRVNSRLSREGIPETTPPPPPRGLTRVPSTEQTHSYSPEGQSGVSPVMLASNQIPTVIPPQTLPKPLYSNAPTPPTLYPSPQGTTPLTPPTPQGPGPGVGLVSPGVPQGSILGTSLEDEFTRELQRQKQEYESKKKAAELLRIQHEEEEERRTAVQRVQAAEEEEREARRRAAQRIQEEQQALLNKQREINCKPVFKIDEAEIKSTQDFLSLKKMIIDG